MYLSAIPTIMLHNRLAQKTVAYITRIYSHSHGLLVNCNLTNVGQPWQGCYVSGCRSAGPGSLLLVWVQVCSMCLHFGVLSKGIAAI